MHRTINWVLILAMLTGMFALYVIKDGTRRLEARVQAQERALERAENDVSVLTAERALLARPARLERWARKLGMAPIDAQQYLRLETAPDRETRVGAMPAERHSDGGNDRSSAVPRPADPSPLAVWLSECSSCLNPPRGQGGDQPSLRAGETLSPSAR